MRILASDEAKTPPVEGWEAFLSDLIPATPMPDYLVFRAG